MKKEQLKGILTVVIGVLVAGYVMQMGKTWPIIGDAQRGYN